MKAGIDSRSFFAQGHVKKEEKAHLQFLETFHKEITKIMLIYNDEISIIKIAMNCTGTFLL